MHLCPKTHYSHSTLLVSHDPKQQQSKDPRSRRLRRDVVYDPVNTLDLSVSYILTPPKTTCLVGYPRRDPLQHLRREHKPIRRHEVLGRDCAQRHDLLVCPRVSSDTDRLDRQKCDKCLRDLVVQSSCAHLLDVNVVGVLKDLDLLACDLAEDTDGQSRTREGVSSDKMRCNA